MLSCACAVLGERRVPQRSTRSCTPKHRPRPTVLECDRPTEAMLIVLRLRINCLFLDGGSCVHTRAVGHGRTQTRARALTHTHMSEQWPLYSEFNRGRSMLTDEFKEGRPKSVVVPHNIDAGRELIVQDRHVTYRELKASLRA
ncbi:hypothetical protein EVAR_96306_1 [Eumeta japonica]|uniref:Mariner Mos1 transposase n=1 Tax=Eumeta variegata TaxID=151549 RepID=A0A4C1VYY7_EUMVA|nr:hypothetical protein EVAR_96306_1 [Eumeta japonica]